jgi:hypothetical protein
MPHPLRVGLLCGGITTGWLCSRGTGLPPLVDCELGVVVDEEVVSRWEVARALDTANQVFQASDQWVVSSLVIRHTTIKIGPDCLVLARSLL